MTLKILQSSGSRRVSPEHIIDYATFAKHYRIGGANELQVFERFQAARSLIAGGYETFLDASVSDADKTSAIHADVCGRKGGLVTLILCSAGKTDRSLMPLLEKVQRSANARAVILSSLAAEIEPLEKSIPDAFRSGKIAVEALGWFDDHFDKTFLETLHLIDLLANETRMRMLAPLFRKTAAKREYRASINPKLVYQNLSVLLQAGIVDEVQEGNYDLSELGKTILAEFMSFLDKTRRTLDKNVKEKEVNVNG